MILLTGISPSPGEKLVSLDSPVEFTLVDDGTGIDISTLIVEIKGFRSISGTSFESGFDGALSSILPEGANFIVVVDPESNFLVGKAYDVKIQVRNFAGVYLNRTYSFKTIPNEPILVTSSPNDGEVLFSPQVLYFEFEDIIDGIDKDSVTISLNGLNYILDGSVDLEHNGPLSDITISGTSCFVRIDPIESLRNGSINLRYSISDTTGNFLISDINFSVSLKDLILPPIFPQSGFSGFFQGIERVSDVGSGDSVFIEWNESIQKNYKNESFVIVYEDSFRLNVFDNPKYISLPGIREANLSGLAAGVSLSFGARSLEVSVDVFDLVGMEEVDSGFYRLPESSTVISNVEPSGLFITVDSVYGYPNAGIIIIGNEVIRYDSLDRVTNTFSVSINGRGILETSPGFYLPGDSVKLFLDCTDVNTVIVMSTPTYQDGYDFERFVNGEGVVVTDYSDNDKVFYTGFDFCGWHDPRPEEVLTGKSGADCGSYIGGEFNGFRGFNLYDRMLNREEVLLGVTGEPVILLKRIWDGITCTCMDSRKMSPKVKSCQECYGTGYSGGYLQYDNLRRTDRRILVSYSEASEDLSLGEQSHLRQEFEPSCWTTPIPAIRDRDLILRFDFTEDFEFIYEVLSVGREKIFNRRFGKQTIALKRLDKTDIVYTYDFNLSNIPVVQ